ncbi:MAG: hypothetical protein U0235_34550 [Polyangiaceae bacterium]
MKRALVAATSLALVVSGVLSACDDGADAVVASDGGVGGDGSTSDAAIATDASGGADAAVPDSAVPDAAADADAGPEGRPPWLLLSVNYQSDSELIAYSPTARDVDGRLSYSGYVGLTTIDALGRPFLLEQTTDRVVELDPLAPWKERASWDVHGTDGVDGGAANADPVAVVPTSPGKAYVIRFNRNQIAVIDDTLKADASAPTKMIDLGAYLDPSDTDHSVDPVGAVYTNGRLYVLLGNLDLNKVSPTGYFTICTTTQPTVVAIDPATDSVVPVVDGGAASGIKLPGYNSNLNGLYLDAPRHRLLALQGGCNPELADAGKGTLERRQVDAIDLTTGNVSVALDLNAEGFPNAMVRASADEMIIGFDFYSAKRWSLGASTLGADVGDGLTSFAADPQGNVHGVRTTYLADGGSTREIVSYPPDGGAANVLGPLPTAKSGGFAGAVDFFAP